jgi:hypothetical protein
LVSTSGSNNGAANLSEEDYQLVKAAIDATNKEETLSKAPAADYQIGSAAAISAQQGDGETEDEEDDAPHGRPASKPISQGQLARANMKAKAAGTSRSEAVGEKRKRDLEQDSLGEEDDHAATVDEDPLINVHPSTSIADKRKQASGKCSTMPVKGGSLFDGISDEEEDGDRDSNIEHVDSDDADDDDMLTVVAVAGNQIGRKAKGGPSGSAIYWEEEEEKKPGKGSRAGRSTVKETTKKPAQRQSSRVATAPTATTSRGSRASSRLGGGPKLKEGELTFSIVPSRHG